MNLDYFQLFANCIPVKGANRTIIADLQRSEYYVIPEGLYDVLTEHKDKSIIKIKEIYDDNEVSHLLDNLLKNLIEMELGFWCDNPNHFPDLSLVYSSPSIIDNAILELRNDAVLPLEIIFEDLTKLGCKFLELRLIGIFSFLAIAEIVEKMALTTFRNIEILVNYSTDFEEFDFKNFLLKNQRVGKVMIYNALSNELRSFNSDAQVIFTTQDLSSNIHCGNIHERYFSINLPTFTEAQQHNTCLNRKISIDQNGNIKNCPSMTESYGNVKNIRLQEALNHPDFKKYWNIKKDQISICQDCEFRYICTDCRAFLENPDDIYSKPLKCGYNPYTSAWEDWSKNPLKQKTMEKYISST